MRVSVRRAALIGFAFLMVLSIVVEILAARHFSPPYNWISNTISDLGVTTCTTIHTYFNSIDVCSPAHAWVNTSVAVTGLAMIGLATVRARAAGFDRFAGLAWVVAGVSTLATALVPFDVSIELHNFVSIPQIIALPLAVLASSTKFRGLVGGIGKIIGVVGLAAGLWMLFDLSSFSYVGLLERIIQWPAYVWVFSASIFGRLRRPLPQPVVA